MQTTPLASSTRIELGKNPNRRLRATGNVPAIVYGKAVAPVAVSVNEKAIDAILKSKLGANTLIDLTIDEKVHHQVLIKDFHGHVISRRLKHVDFYVVSDNQEVLVSIPVHFTGKAKGITNAGTMEVKLHEIELFAQVGKIPESITVDVTELDVGDNIHLNEITLPTGTRAREGYNPTIVLMSLIKEEVAAPVVVAAAAAPAAGAPAAAGATPAAGAAPAAGAKAAAPAAAPKKGK